VLFLAEAFTRPAPMTALAKSGFAQSYTYFTWKNSRWELLEFLGQLLDWREFYRPNCFANTPDILHEYLQNGGRAAFEARLVLAATLSPSYGLYSGFEQLENVPVRPGSEEYLNSEKYELKQRTLDGPLLPLVAKLNAARRENPALQWLEPLTVLETENERLFAFLKRHGENSVVSVVNLDPAATQAGVCVVPVSTGFSPAYPVQDLLSDETWTWRIGRNYVKLGPGQSHVLRIGGR
jgi:starch synthase (maltosyl-transferring)